MTTHYVSFLLGADRYCVPVDEVVQIVRPEGILRVPKAPSFISGVINIRGDVIPVIDLKARLGVRGTSERDSAGGRSASRARIIVITAGNRSFGLAVDEVREIVDIDESLDRTEMPLENPARAPFIHGAAAHDGGTFLILDLLRVISVSRDLASAGSV
jgi:purine-binding chemotaxis protein CheW